MLAPVDIDGDGRTEMACLCGPELSIFNRQGERVYHQQCDYFSFNAMAGHSKPANELVLGSVKGADRKLYAVRFEGAGKDAFAMFEPNHGFIRTVDGNLAAIRDEVLRAPASTPPPDRKYTIWVTAGSPPPK